MEVLSNALSIFSCGYLNPRQDHFSFALKFGKNFPNKIVDVRTESKCVGIEKVIKLLKCFALKPNRYENDIFYNPARLHHNCRLFSGEKKTLLCC